MDVLSVATTLLLYTGAREPRCKAIERVPNRSPRRTSGGSSDGELCRWFNQTLQTFFSGDEDAGEERSVRRQSGRSVDRLGNTETRENTAGDSSAETRARKSFGERFVHNGFWSVFSRLFVIV